jgi:hypothetical protein
MACISFIVLLMHAESHVGIRAKSPPLLLWFNRNCYISTHFLELSHVKCDKYPCNGSVDVERTQRDGQAEVAKLGVFLLLSIAETRRKWILQKWYVKVQTKLSCLRLCLKGGFLLLWSDKEHSGSLYGQRINLLRAHEVLKEWRMPSSGMWRRVDLVWSDVSEERIASIFRVEKSAS